MLHLDAHKYPTIARVFLSRGVGQIDKLQWLAEQDAKLVARRACVVEVGRVEGIVMKGHAVGHAHEKQGPVRTALGDLNVPTVVDRQEYMCLVCEVRQHAFESVRVVGFDEHEGHRRAK